MGRTTSDLEVSPHGSDVRPGERRERPGLSRALLVVAPFALILLAYPLDVPLCPSKQLFGVPCPGCGLTRATVALASLDFGTAMAMHPLVPIVLPLLAWAIGRMALVAAGRLPPTGGVLERVPRAVWIGFVVLLIGVWALRLAGLFGGPPDPVDPASGLLGRTWGLLVS